MICLHVAFEICGVAPQRAHLVRERVCVAPTAGDALHAAAFDELLMGRFERQTLASRIAADLAATLSSVLLLHQHQHSTTTR